MRKLLVCDGTVFAMPIHNNVPFAHKIEASIRLPYLTSIAFWTAFCHGGNFTKAEVKPLVAIAEPYIGR
jgi:hypothetical protein